MRRNVLLWAVQVLVAVVFLFAGGLKLILPADAMQGGAVSLPGPFLRFIGTAEVLRGLGLILPGLLRIRRALTPVAAGGLVIIMSGATVISLMAAPRAAAIVPAVVGTLAVTIARGRWDWVHDQERATAVAADLRHA